jgi:HTH-type transcriptional regulator/antitoxin HipB
MSPQIQTIPQLGSQIRELRIAQGLSQSQLGEKLGLSQARISRIEKSPERISVAHLMRVLSVLDASISVELHRDWNPIHRQSGGGVGRF